MAAPKIPLRQDASASAPPPLRAVPAAPPIAGTAEQLTLDLAVDRRRFSIYEPLAAFGLVDELEFLTRRSVESVPFYAPQFMVPGMPRLDERQVRLLVMRDERDERSRLRALLPFSVERCGLLRGPLAVRAWSHPLAPRATIPIDRDDPRGTVASLFRTLADGSVGLPPLLVLPDVALGGPVARVLQEEIGEQNLHHAVVDRRSRGALDATKPVDGFLERTLSARRRRELGRKRRLLEAVGAVGFESAESQGEIRLALEEFLLLEASGWKGRQRSALLNDRYRAAFAREAIMALAAFGRVRIHTLTVGARAVASLVVLVAQGEALLWKIAFDERHRNASPGLQLLASSTQALLQDPAVRFVDSCAVPGHPLVSRLWHEQIEIGTLVIGVEPGERSRRAVHQAARGIEQQRALLEAVWRARTVLRRAGLR